MNDPLLDGDRPTAAFLHARGYTCYGASPGYGPARYLWQKHSPLVGPAASDPSPDKNRVTLSLWHFPPLGDKPDVWELEGYLEFPEHEDCCLFRMYGYSTEEVPDRLEDLEAAIDLAANAMRIFFRRMGVSAPDANRQSNTDNRHVARRDCRRQENP